MGLNDSLELGYALSDPCLGYSYIIDPKGSCAKVYTRSVLPLAGPLLPRMPKDAPSL